MSRYKEITTLQEPETMSMKEGQDGKTKPLCPSHQLLPNSKQQNPNFREGMLGEKRQEDQTQQEEDIG